MRSLALIAFPLALSLSLSLSCSKGSNPLKPAPGADSGTGERGELTVLPFRFDFGPTAIGEPASMSLTLSNQGAVPIEVGRTIGGRGVGRCDQNGTAFCVDFNGATLASGTSIEVAVIFRPAVAGPHEATLRFECDGRDCDVEVPLDGQGIDAALDCQPEQLSFYYVNPGQCGVRSVSCQNRANGTIEVTSIELEDELFQVTSSAPLVIAPNRAEQLEVRFCPLERGPVNASLIVRGTHSSLGMESSVVQISAHGGGPDIAVEPAAIDFGRVATIAPAHRRLMVSNIGDAALDVVAARVEGTDASAFSVSFAGSSIGVGGTELLELQFAPDRTGPFSASLIFDSNDPNQSHLEVPITGEGVAVGPCAYELDATSVDFGDVQRGERSIAFVGITNRGSDECLVTSVGLLQQPGGAFSLPGPSLTSIAPGDHAMIPVVFAPYSARPEQNELELGLSSPVEPVVRIGLLGEGRQVTPLIGSQHVDFGVQPEGCTTATRTVSLHNRSEVPFEVTWIRMLGAGFSPSALPVMPRTMAPFDSLSFDVAFEPSAAGVYASSMVIETSGGDAAIALTAASAAASTQVDRFTQLSSSEVDVLFVLDHTACSTIERLALGAEIGAFLELPRGENLDYHLGVTTSDLNREGGRLVHALFPDPFGGPFEDRIITDDTLPSPESVFASNARARAEDGAAGLDESPLEAGRVALSDPALFADNAGFLRYDARLAVVVMADEPDQSPGTVDFYLDAFRRMKSDPHQVTISTIGGDPPIGCTSTELSAPYDARTASLAERSGGTLMSMCSSDWAADLARLSQPAFGTLSKFELTSTPVFGSVAVSLDGAAFPAVANGITRWHIEGRRLVFDPVSVPEPGTEIRVEYTARCP